MKDLSQRCIFSGSSENLNTIIEITLDGEKYKVAVSDEYEEDASPGAIKKLIPERVAAMEAAKAEMINKLEEFKALAAELGFDLIRKGEQPPPQPTPQVKPDDSRQPGVKQQKNMRKEVSREEAIAAHEAAKRETAPIQVTRSAAGITAPISPHVIPEQIEVKTRDGTKIVEKPEKFDETHQLVRGPGGITIPVPRSIKGTDGETTITITNGIDDKIIQQRGKQLNMMRENDDYSFWSDECRQCSGAGIIENRRGQKKQCKTCGGAGIII